MIICNISTYHHIRSITLKNMGCMKQIVSCSVFPISIKMSGIIKKNVVEGHVLTVMILTSQKSYH